MDAHRWWARRPRAALALVVTVAGAVLLAASPAQASSEGPVVVSLTFDDGLTSQYKAGALMEKHGVRGTYYVNSGAIDERGGHGTMSWAWAKQLARAGHEIGGHTRDHYALTGADLTYAGRWQQICSDRARLAEKGLHPTSFAYPTGAIEDTSIEILEACGYQSARTAGSLLETGPHYAETVPPLHGPYRVRALGGSYNGPVTAASMQTAVEAAHAHGGGWLPLLFHRVCFRGQPEFKDCMASYRPIDAAVFDRFLSWVTAPAQRSRGISVRTVTQAFNSGRPVPSVRVTAPPSGKVAEPTELRGLTSVDGPVTVEIFQGRYSTGTPLQTLGTTSSGRSWRVPLPATVPYGDHTVRASVTAGGVTGVSVPVTFSVVPRPVVRIDKVSRRSLGQGATQAIVKLHGRFAPGSVAVISGKGASVSTLSRSPRLMKVAVTIGSGARAGLRTVGVTDGVGGQVSCDGCLRIVRGPRVKRLDPATVQPGALTWVTVRGSGFTRQTRASVTGGAVRVNEVRYVAPSRLEVSVEVDAGARRTARALVLTDTATAGRHVLRRALRIG